MAKSNNRGRSSRHTDLHVMELARERPFAAAAAAAGAAATGLFLWSKRAQISDQLSHLNDQIGEWRESMRSNGELETAQPNSSTASRAKGRRSAGMSETGAGNASLGARSGGGMRSSASGRGRAQSAPIQ